MELLKSSILALVASAMGCYAPDLPDCAVTCATDEDCAGDQVCTDQKRCAAAGQTCTANMLDAGAGETTDAGSGARMVQLKIAIMGEGKVTITNVGDCTAPLAPMAPPCQWTVPAGRYQFTATATRENKPFDKWTSLLCGGQGATCQADVLVGGTASAKFH